MPCPSDGAPVCFSLLSSGGGDCRPEFCADIVVVLGLCFGEAGFVVFWRSCKIWLMRMGKWELGRRKAPEENLALTTFCVESFLWREKLEVKEGNEAQGELNNIP